MIQEALANGQRGVLTARWKDERIIRAVDDERGHPDGCQPWAPITSDGNRREMPSSSRHRDYRNGSRDSAVSPVPGRTELSIGPSVSRAKRSGGSPPRSHHQNSQKANSMPFALRIFIVVFRRDQAGRGSSAGQGRRKSRSRPCDTKVGETVVGGGLHRLPPGICRSFYTTSKTGLANSMT